MKLLAESDVPADLFVSAILGTNNCLIVDGVAKLDVAAYCSRVNEFAYYIENYLHSDKDTSFAVGDFERFKAISFEKYSGYLSCLVDLNRLLNRQGVNSKKISNLRAECDSKNLAWNDWRKAFLVRSIKDLTFGYFDESDWLWKHCHSSVFGFLECIRSIDDIGIDGFSRSKYQSLILGKIRTMVKNGNSRMAEAIAKMVLSYNRHHCVPAVDYSEIEEVIKSC